MYPYNVDPQENNAQADATRYVPPPWGNDPMPNDPPPEQRDGYRPPPHPSGPRHPNRPNEGRPQGPPSGPPPNVTPRESPGLYAVDPGAIRGCLYNYTYVWLNSGQSFWIYPTYVGRTSLSGYRWSRFGWVYTGLDLNIIESFYCSPY